MENCWTSYIGSSFRNYRILALQKFWTNFGPKFVQNFEICHVCDRNIERLDDFRHLTHWGLKFCKMHEADGTPRCSCCDRFKTIGQMEYVNLGDGRKLCSDCYSIAILDTSTKFNHLIKKTREFYKELNLEVDKDIPILLVNKDSMYTMRTVGMISYAPLTVTTITNCSKNGDNIEVKTTEKTLTEGQVKAMLLLFGRPEVILGATLAHEMMHAWLFLKGCRELDRKVSEGICEVMGDMWLDWFCDETKNNLDSYTTEQAEFTKNLKRFVADKMKKNVDKIYGEGFREAQQMHEVDGTSRCICCDKFKVGRKTFTRNCNGEELGLPFPCCL